MFGPEQDSPGHGLLRPAAGGIGMGGRMAGIGPGGCAEYPARQGARRRERAFGGITRSARHLGSNSDCFRRLRHSTRRNGTDPASATAAGHHAERRNRRRSTIGCKPHRRGQTFGGAGIIGFSPDEPQAIHLRLQEEEPLQRVGVPLQPPERSAEMAGHADGRNQQSSHRLAGQRFEPPARTAELAQRAASTDSARHRLPPPRHAPAVEAPGQPAARQSS